VGRDIRFDLAGRSTQDSRPMKQEQARVVEHYEFQGGYRLLRLVASEVGPQVQPGQFIHLLVPRLEAAVLRRPFSVFKANVAGLTILYKPVGRGTEAMTRMREGDAVDVIGPLGRGFPVPDPDAFPLLIGGGYGSAALYLQAARSVRKGVVFFGGRTARDILCADEFEALGWEVRIATEDGSLGCRGLVTDILDDWLAEHAEPVEVFACGPNGMLRAVGDRFIGTGRNAWLSMDRNMACGVGACLTCVIRLRDSAAPDGWKWGRCCKDGPVFNAREILWEE